VNNHCAFYTQIAQHLRQWFNQIPVIYAHQFHFCACGVGKRSYDVKNRPDGKLFADRRNKLHCDMVVLCKHKTYPDIFQQFCAFLR
jgi:hypothetical protein